MKTRQMALNYPTTSTPPHPQTSQEPQMPSTSTLMSQIHQTNNIKIMQEQQQDGPGESVEVQYLGLETTVVLLIGTFLLALGFLLLTFFVYVCVKKLYKQPNKPLPLPTPPQCRRQVSVRTVYPPTPPISRQQYNIYTICRPTPPASPLLTTKGFGKATLPLYLRLQESDQPLAQTHTPPLTRKHKPLRSTSSLPSQLNALGDKVLPISPLVGKAAPAYILDGTPSPRSTLEGQDSLCSVPEDKLSPRSSLPMFFLPHECRLQMEQSLPEGGSPHLPPVS